MSASTSDRVRTDATSSPSTVRRTVRRTPPTHRTPLTPVRITAAALALVDREGLDALTMRRLALDLGSAPMAAYSHFAGKRAVLGAIVDAVMGEVDLPEIDGRWRKPLRRLAVSFRAAMLAHPAVMPALHADGVRGPNMLAFLDRMSGILRGAGFADAQVVGAADTLLAFMVGAVSLEIAGASVDPAARHAVRYALPPAEFPHLAALMPTALARDDEARFRYGLDRVLDGLAAAKRAGAT